MEKALFATGGPFPEVNHDGKCYKPGQGNNSYIFPGIGLGIVLYEVQHINEEIFLIAARVAFLYSKHFFLYSKEVASSVTEEDISFGCIYPSLCKIREISVSIVLEIGKYSYKRGMAGLYSEPENMEQYIRSQIYSVHYDELICKQYNWPIEDTIKSIPVLPAKENNS
uniref:Malic enzyme NAD-binding domain-containing protein n=1 Tax=Wuchereria bancrofti TaxID=6293 RepID=A0AAF5PRT2_WUCBA